MNLPWGHRVGYDLVTEGQQQTWNTWDLLIENY